MKKLSIRGKLMLMVLPLAILAIVITILLSKNNTDTYNDSKSLYYDQLYQANSTLINADRDFYQAYTALLENLNNTDPEATYLADYDENIQQTKERVDTVMDIVAKYEALGAYSSNGKTMNDLYNEFNENMDLMYSAYTPSDGSGSLTDFDTYFNATRDDISGMEDLIEAYATASDASLSSSINASLLRAAIVLAVILVICIALSVFIIAYIRRSITAVTNSISTIAAKDLSAEVNVIDGVDEIAELSRSAATLQEQFLEMVDTLKGSSDGLTDSSRLMANSTTEAVGSMDNIDNAAGELAKTASNTAEEISQVTQEISVIDDMTKKSLGETASLSAACEGAKTTTQNGMRTVNELSNVTEQSMEAFSKIFEAIAGFSESTKTIGEASNMITDIASQTNLLSLNASIEAARAGEAGKGFAVVADEIRTLAEQSASSADTINSMIAELQKNAQHATEMSSLVKEYVEKQRTSVQETRGGFEEIVGNLGTISDGVVQLRGVNEKLGEEVDTISALIEALSAESEENAATAQELSATTATVSGNISVLADTGKEINESADGLSALIAEYKTE